MPSTSAKPLPKELLTEAPAATKTTTVAASVGTLLRTDAAGGVLLVIAAVTSLIWANSSQASTYFALRDFQVGYEPWHLRLSLGEWAADGLLAVFFFLIGLELKREIVAGHLRSIRTAIIPVVAAIGGVVVPALIYLALVSQHAELQQGWAIPTATDIAFALAVLALIGSHLPPALRIFLLTLAVVDDLIAISIIAIFYTLDINLAALLVGMVLIAGYAYVASRYRSGFIRHQVAAWVVLLPIGILAWVFIHASGIHATVTGVLLGFAIPVRPRNASTRFRPAPSLAATFEHRFRPLSTGIAVPIFAFFAAGVSFGGGDGITASLRHPLTIAVIAALVIGKPVGIVTTTWLMNRYGPGSLDRSIAWVDLTGIGILAGIGFTVSLLVANLSFLPGSVTHDDSKAAILLASGIATALAATLLVLRNRLYRRRARAEATPTD